MIVVADTSVILNLCCVGQAHLLPALFHEVWIPDEVRIEFERLSLTSRVSKGFVCLTGRSSSLRLRFPPNLPRLPISMQAKLPLWRWP